MNTSTLVLVSVIVLLAITFVAFAILTAGKLSALEAESNVLETKLANRDAEIAHLRTQHAHKIDRALFMLARVRTTRTPTESLRIDLTLEPALADALAQAHEDATSGFREIVAEHLVRRVAKAATVTGGQRT